MNRGAITVFLAHCLTPLPLPASAQEHLRLRGEPLHAAPWRSLPATTMLVQTAASAARRPVVTPRTQTAPMSFWLAP